MKAYATKLIDLTESHAEKIAGQWARDVKTNVKTSSYRGVPDEKIILQATEFYRHFREMFFHDAPYKQAEKFSRDIRRERYRDGIPLHEAVFYALILMRRHIWGSTRSSRPSLLRRWNTGRRWRVSAEPS